MNRITVRHALDGRVRLRVPAARDARTALRIGQRLKAVEGVRWVRCNTRCAGVVVRYDRAVLSADDIVALMAGLAGGGAA
ncbi:MAG: hypothetical protein V3571_14490 [Pseudodesulfovibrio sp.]